MSRIRVLKMADFRVNYMDSFANTVRGTVACASILVLSGCLPDGGLSSNSGGPSSQVQTLARPNPDARGVITYNTYQVMVARSGDTVETMAERVGISPAQLANHNGLPAGYRPRSGEVLALPKNVGGSPADNGWTAGSVWTPDVATQALDEISPQQATSTIPSPFSNGQTSTVVDPVRHRVKPGETAYSIARLHGVSVTALASWNGLSSDLAVRENQELLIPIATETNTRVAAVNRPGTNSGAGLPPSASEPLPPNQDVAATGTLASPNLGAQRTSTAPKFQAPVSGRVIKPFSRASGSDRNDGIDIAAAAGSTVRAAADGQVALVSESLNGDDTIVLIRHSDGDNDPSNDLITVYSRVTGVTLKKGERVKAGERVGVVAAGANPNVHFEVRRGSAAVDPTPYL